MPRIVSKLFFCSIHFQFKFVVKMFRLLRKDTPVKKLRISKVEIFLKSNFDINDICKRMFTQSHYKGTLTL